MTDATSVTYLRRTLLRKKLTNASTQNADDEADVQRLRADVVGPARRFFFFFGEVEAAAGRLCRPSAGRLGRRHPTAHHDNADEEEERPPAGRDHFDGAGEP